MTADLYAALSAFQGDLVTVGKSSENPFFKSKFAALGDMQKAAAPYLAKHGLAVLQFPTHIDGRPAVATIITHASGSEIGYTTPLMMVKDDPQAQGSALTYARRYAYAAALGIVIDDDDDAERAMDRSRPTGPVDDPWTLPAPPPPDPGLREDGKPLPENGPLSDMATSPQIRKIQVMAKEAGYAEMEAIYVRLSEILDREILSSKNLSKRDASLVIAALDAENRGK